MKRTLALILALTLAFVFAACGNTKAGDDAPDYAKELNSAGKIVVGTSPDYSPYEYYDENGKMVGFDIEAMEAIAAIMGEDYAVAVEWVPMDFSTIVSAVQLGQVDIGVSCFTYDAERDVLFSNYYLKSAQVIVVPAGSSIKTLSDLSGKTVGAGLGTTGEASAKAIDGVTVTEMGDYAQMFEILKNDGLEAIVCDEAVALKYAEQSQYYKVLDEKLVDEEVSVIVAKEHTALLDAINSAIEKFVASDTYTDLKVKYGLN